MTVEDTLAQVELFADLDDEGRARIAKSCVVRDFNRGDVIVRENETGVAFYIISKGSVEVVKGLGTPNEQVLAMLGQGSFFGEMALFDNHPRSASVRAASEATQCLVLTRWDLNAELAQDGRLGLAMLAVLARRIRALDAEAHTH